MKLKTKMVSLFIIATIVSTTSFAQIPNSGFEQWNGNNPSIWATSNVNEFIFVTAEPNLLSGSYAAKVETKAYNGILGIGLLSAGETGEGFPVSQRHEQVSLYYKFNKTLSSAYLIISIGFKKGENGIGAGVISINEPASEYVPITVPVTYINNEIPDLAVITIIVNDQFMNPTASGSYAVIDDLSFNIISDVDDDNSSPDNFTLEQNYPNPFNPNTKIGWQSTVSGHQTLKVYDIIGNEVATLVNEYKPAGSYQLNFDASDLTSGVYLYRLQTGSNIITKKMTLIK